MARETPNSNEALDIVLMKGRKKVELKFTDLIDILSMIREFEQEEQFARLIKEKSLTVSVGSKTVNAVKLLVASHEGMRSHATGRKILFPPARDDSERGGLSSAARSDFYSTCCGFSDRG